MSIVDYGWQEWLLLLGCSLLGAMIGTAIAFTFKWLIRGVFLKDTEWWN